MNESTLKRASEALVMSLKNLEKAITAVQKAEADVVNKKVALSRILAAKNEPQQPAV